MVKMPRVRKNYYAVVVPAVNGNGHIVISKRVKSDAPYIILDKKIKDILYGKKGNFRKVSKNNSTKKKKNYKG